MAAPKTKIGFVGRGGFSGYMQDLLKDHPSFHLASVSHTASPYQNDSREIQTVYICTPDLLHTQILKQAIDGGKHHVLCEKPCFLSEADFEDCLQKSQLAELEVQINFQRRFDSLYQSAREAYRAALQDSDGDVDLHLIAKDPVPHENEPYKYLHNSVVHDVDSAVWFNWPFESARISHLSFTGAPDFHLSLTISFTFADKKKEVHTRISFNKGNKTYVNRIEITRPGLTRKVFEEDFSGQVFFDRYKKAYQLMWENFHASAKKRLEGKKDLTPTDNSLSHPSFKFTYKLLDQVLNLCKTTILNQ
jgi:predicted dehydrogenase